MNEPAYLASYGRRRGRRLKQRKQELVDSLLPRLRISETYLPEPDRPLWIEIGFGSGEHLAALAAAHPDVQLIGCEPYLNGVAHLLQAIDRHTLENIRIFDQDARLLLEALPPGSVERIYLLYPDPWPKQRHHKRRFISLQTLELLAQVLRPGGLLRIATDHADYGAWILEHLLACPDFAWTARRSADWKQPPAEWVQTRYEAKAGQEGRPPLYLDFKRLEKRE